MRNIKFLVFIFYELGKLICLDSQRLVLKDVLRDVEIGDKGSARERIVRMMSDERGVAAWGTALRMVVENLQL